MAISKEDVEHIARLARLALQGGEAEKFQGELGGILEYVDQLQKIDIEGVEPLRTLSGAHDALRNDEHAEDINRRPEGQELIEQAPETKDRFVKTKGVFGEERSV